MAFKVILCVAAMAIACAQAKPGGPAAYSISAPSVDHASVGNTQEHTVKGHYGQSSQSDYASQVQTAHSQSHVQRSSISNDAGLAPAAHYAAPAAHAIAAPASYALGVGHTGPAQIQGLAYASHGYAAAPAPAPAPAPVLAYGGHYGAQYGGGHYAATAPALQLSGVGLGHYGHIGHLGHVGLGYGYGGYSSGPALSHGYAQVAAAPAQIVKYAAAPAYAPGIIGHGYAPAAYAAPAYAAHLGAPVLKAAVAAPALVHTSVSGHGIHYGY
ncbi:cuticle protein 21.3 isoform X1 [Drosophila guanche]|uniref:cuticle protein 21.3 isoform X1 n=1 Tax=Drosophila guanche TaxID=7266 RepID=UPI0014724AAC|nr:cuticle protein 21.3 isoform X1 [Drosophila guanche]